MVLVRTVMVAIFCLEETETTAYYSEALGYCRAGVIGKYACISSGSVLAVWDLASSLLSV